MKQTLTALLLALTMLFSLTGCTRKDDPNDSMNNGGNSGTTNNGTVNNGVGNNGTVNDGNTNNGTMNGGTNTGDNSSAANNDTGSNNSTGSRSRSSGSDDLFGGRSYDQMLRDGQVHDSDGFLADGENSRSDW